VDEALCVAPHIEKKPSSIVVNDGGKYPEIVSFEWGETA